MNAAYPVKWRPLFCQNPYCKQRLHNGIKRLAVDLPADYKGPVRIVCPACKERQEFVLE